MVWACLLLAGGLAMLWKSADLLVSGAVALAQRLGVSPLVIGLTVVAMGTSAPEVAASIAAAVGGAGDLAIGNVYGSNIANLALVGGVIALIRPLRIKKLTLGREIPVMLVSALLLWPILRNLDLSRLEGLALLVLFAGLILLTVHLARREARVQPEVVAEISEDVPEADKPASKPIKTNLLFIAIGLGGLTLGAKYMVVVGAIFIGRKVGLSEAVIGLTIVAFGTSLPELVTCVVATIRGHHDISVGNLVGSNIFNTLLVVGAAGLIRPFAVGPRLAVGVDYWIMIIVSAGFTTLAIVGRRTIGRISGTLLLCTYFGYIIYLLAYSG